MEDMAHHQHMPHGVLYRMVFLRIQLLQLGRRKQVFHNHNHNHNHHSLSHNHGHLQEREAHPRTIRSTSRVTPHQRNPPVGVKPMLVALLVGVNPIPVALRLQVGVNMFNSQHPIIIQTTPYPRIFPVQVMDSVMSGAAGGQWRRLGAESLLLQVERCLRHLGARHQVVN